MKNINVTQFIAAVCLLIGSAINLLDLLIGVPFWLHVCTLPILLVSVVLFGVVWHRHIKSKKEDGDKTK